MDLFADFRKLVRPAYEGQTQNRRLQLLKNTVRMMAAMSGLYVIRLSAPEVIRILGVGTNDADPLKQALTKLDSIFSQCQRSGIDMKTSVNELVKIHETDKTTHCTVFLAWRILANKSPELVGAATCSKFIDSQHISTQPNNLGANYDALSKFFNTYFYIDTLCSKQKPAGKLLVLHALEFALRKKLKGLIAFSFAGEQNRNATSENMFKSLKFKMYSGEEIEKSGNNILLVDGLTLYGKWVVKKVDDFSGLNDQIMSICTRSGLTERTKDNLIWRCPI